MTLVRYADLLLAALALPVFIAAGFPILGWAGGTGLWVAQRGIQVLLDRKARASEDPKTMVGISAGSMIGRGWLVALTIFAVGLADSEAGLAAAVLVLALFTVHFSTSMILGPLDKTSVSSP